MILSLKHKFLFLKGRKVGGTSVEMALSVLCGPDDVVTPITARDEVERMRMGGRARNYSDDPAAEEAYSARLPTLSREELGKTPLPGGIHINHADLASIVALEGERVLGYRQVCVERSPYAKILSWANMERSRDLYRRGGEMRTDWATILDVLDQGIRDRSILEVRNIDIYRAPDGRVTAEVMRYEQLEADYRAFVHSLGVATPPPLPHAKKGLMSDGFDPREVFRSDQLRAINDLFQEEFERFGYPVLD